MPGPRTSIQAVIVLLALAFLSARSPAVAAEITEYPVPNQPELIAAGPDGNVWFTEFAPSVGRISPTGAVTEFPVVANVGGITAGPDQAIWLAGKKATYDPGDPTPFAATIFRVTTAGSVSSFPLPDPASAPGGIVSGPDDALWFVDVFADWIGRMTTAGRASAFDLPNPGSRTHSIAAGPDGALWFAEMAGAKIGRITTDGTVTEFPVDGVPRDIASGPDGALWFTLLDRVGRITPAGVVSTYPLPARPRTITAGPDDALWFTEDDADKIGRISTRGEISELPLPTAGSSAGDITTGPDGNIWFTEPTARKLGRVLLRPPSTTPTLPVAAPPAPPRDVTAPALTMRAVKQSLSDVVRKGLAVRVACDERCSMLVRVSVTRALARRLHVPQMLGSARFAVVGPMTAHVKLSKRANRALRTQRRVVLRVSATPTDVAGNTGVVRSVSVTVRR